MEADCAKVSPVEAGFNGGNAGGAVGRAERLHPLGTVALRQERIEVVEPGRKSPDQLGRDERHVPGNEHEGGGGGEECGMDPTQRAQPGTEVGNDAEAGPPRRGIGSIGNKKGRLSQRPGKTFHQAIQDPRPTYDLEALGAAAVPGCFTAGQDDASNAGTQYRVPRRRSSMISPPNWMLHRCS
jgi:hypothetical protein